MVLEFAVAVAASLHNNAPVETERSFEDRGKPTSVCFASTRCLCVARERNKAGILRADLEREGEGCPFVHGGG